MVILAAAAALAAAIAAAALHRAGGRPGRDARPRETAMSPAVAPSFDVLKGRWVRLDGGYVLEVSAVDPAGAVTAAYLNPRPVNVARAEASVSGSALSVFVELRAPGYPGSTYTLTYDPGGDQLAGVYVQAALQQRFDVTFSRVK